MIKKLWIYVSAAALLLVGCDSRTTEPSDSAEDGATPSSAPTEMVVVTPEEGFDQNYADCIETYFQAVEDKAFEGYQKTVYPPYQEAFGEYLKAQDGTGLEDFFATLCTEFDEDGYESWDLTRLELSYRENEDIDNFFQTYENAGLFDAEFTKSVKDDAKEIRDVNFTLYARYEGDEEAVPVVQNREIIVIHTKDDEYYLFG